MRYAWRALLVLAAFFGVGYAAVRLVEAHAAASQTPLPQVQLAAGMAGLFAGGAAACIVTIALVWGRRREE